MRKSNILLLTGLLLLAGCGEKPAEPAPEPADRQLLVEASLEPLSGAEGLPFWQEGDRIGILLGDGSYAPFSLTRGAGSANASFEGSIPAGKALGEEAVYPFDPEASATVTMKAAVREGSVLEFKHLGAMLGFEIRQIPPSASAFRLECPGSVLGGDSYTVSFRRGTLSEGEFMVPVSAGSLPAYKISLCTASGAEVLSWQDDGGISLTRGTLHKTAPLTVQTDGSFRLVVYNILQGMAGDAANNYDNFVAWVRQTVPDVLVLCEAKNFNDAQEKYDSFYKAGIKSRAERWGHNYVETVVMDNYPVAITASRPFTVHQVLDDSSVQRHGALHIETAGFHIVGLHLLPGQNRGGALDQEYSGELRLRELRHILDKTLLNGDYASVNDWIFCGDFNMYARSEAGVHSPFGGRTAYSYPDTAPTAYEVYEEIASRLTDVLLDWGGGLFQPTMWHGRSRIDYIFASAGVYARVKDARVVLGEFPGNYTTEEGANPSDHLPLLMDLADYSFKALDGANLLSDFSEDVMLSD